MIAKASLGRCDQILNLALLAGPTLAPEFFEIATNF